MDDKAKLTPKGPASRSAERSAPTAVAAEAEIVAHLADEIIALQKFPAVKCLTFDIIGTVYDAYGTLAAGIPPLAAHYGIHLNPGTAALQWIQAYASGVAAVNGGGPWTPPDQILENGFRQVLSQNHQPAPSPTEVCSFYELWHKFNPWSDVPEGMTRLHKRFSLAVLSNMSVATQQALKQHAGLPFSHFLSADTVKAYKPNPKVYQMAVKDLNVKPNQIMMVAAHKYDLQAAKAQGFRTAFVARPLELGPNGNVDTTPDPSLDINATSFLDLANKLGV